MKCSFSTLNRSYWTTLDTLHEAGWIPLINYLFEDNRWHVCLHHVSAPVPVLRCVGDIWKAEQHRYIVHASHALLSDTLDDAFAQVYRMLTPPPKEAA